MSMNIVGYSLSNWVNYGLSFVGGAIAWRLPLALQVRKTPLITHSPYSPYPPLIWSMRGILYRIISTNTRHMS